MNLNKKTNTYLAKSKHDFRNRNNVKTFIRLKPLMIIAIIKRVVFELEAVMDVIRVIN